MFETCISTTKITEGYNLKCDDLAEILANTNHLIARFYQYLNNQTFVYIKFKNWSISKKKET